MSRALRAAGVLTLLLPATARLAAAQSTADYARRYRALQQATAQLNAHFNSASQHRLVPGSIDTIRTGALVVYVAPRMRALARAASDTAWRMLTRIFGKHAAVASATPLLLESADQQDNAALVNVVNTAVRVPGGTTAAQITRSILDAIASPIHGNADEELKRWLPWVYTDTILRFHEDALYEELATSPWSAARECFAGDRVACRRALGITRVDPATGWYDATDRRFYVAHMLGTSGTAARDCVEGGDDEACIAMLQRAPGGSPVPPLGAQTRQLLLALAINAGGPQAYERLIAHAGEALENRLAMAANLPIDSLVDHWRARIIAGRPQTVAADARAAWAAVAWGVVLMVVAMGSTRWR
jgi:hypothetical protein